MAKLAGAYRRWRHTRGFGIHSPFAYRLVKEVVSPSPGYLYYAEEEGDMTTLGRLAYRLDIFMRSETGHAPVGRLNEWLQNPSRPLFLLNPESADYEAAENVLRNAGRGLMLRSRRYIIALMRKEMAFVCYDVL